MKEGTDGKGNRTGGSDTPDSRGQRELEQYEAIVQAIGDPVCTFDEEGRFVQVNRAFQDRAGYSEAEVRGEKPTLVMDEDDAERMRDVTRRLDEAGGDGKETVEIELRTRDGTLVPTECQVAVLPAGDGDGNGFVAVMRDITDRKRREERLENFARVVSHDLRNPMDVALGRAEVLPDIADLDKSTERHLDEIYTSLKRMERLVEDVLTLTCADQETVATEPVELSQVVQDAWDTVETEGATLLRDIDVAVHANRSRLQRLFENLFRNAVEHSSTNPGSQVRQDESGVESKGTGAFGDQPDKTLTIEVGVSDIDWEHGTATFYVADNGPGIPKEVRGRVFEDGFSTAGGGTGLGLAIVRDIARAHDWEVHVTDSESGGACFEFTTVQLSIER